MGSGYIGERQAGVPVARGAPTPTKKVLFSLVVAVATE